MHQELGTLLPSALHKILDPEHTTLIVAHGEVYWAIMEMIGFKDQRPHNCDPYFFVPQKIISLHGWFIRWILILK